MKALVLILILAALVAWGLLNRPRTINPPPPYRPLPEGKVNPPLKTVGELWPIPEGTKIWVRTNQEPFAIVASTDDEMVILKDAIDGQTYTTMRRYARHYLIEAK